MITFLIKSTVCLVVLYGFFHFFLRHHKILLFNRFYLITSLVFSIIIPFVNIPVESNFTLNSNLDKIAFIIGPANQGEQIIGNATLQYLYQNIFTVLFIIISSVLLIRFAFNIFRIIRKTIKCKKIVNVNITLILVEEKTLPYSFFRFVFVNKPDFESGKIEKELITHEEAHCLQYHSVDIILLELLNVFFWFNPAIWLFRKAILLNHEYYADNKVLSNSEAFDYHQLLINLVIENNTNYLVSNFKYSLIKNRLIMMTKSRPSHNAILRKIAGITVFLFLGIAFTFSKANMLNSNIFNVENEGWFTMQSSEKPEIWPIKKGEYSKIPSAYGEKRINPITKEGVIHYGIDIEAEMGTVVMATAGGKVIKTSWDKGYGNLIVIDHGDGIQSLYGHLKDLNVKNGDSVIKGQIIGHVGLTGTTSSPHLHFEIRLNGEHVNPLNYLK